MQPVHPAPTHQAVIGVPVFGDALLAKDPAESLGESVGALIFFGLLVFFGLRAMQKSESK